MRKVWRCGTIPPKPNFLSLPPSCSSSSLSRIGSSVAWIGFDLTMEEAGLEVCKKIIYRECVHAGGGGLVLSPSTAPCFPFLRQALTLNLKLEILSRLTDQ